LSCRVAKRSLSIALEISFDHASLNLSSTNELMKG
jgi:hypothetical protein